MAGLKFPEKFNLSLGKLGGQKETLLWIARYAMVMVVFLFIFLPMQTRLSSQFSELKSLKREIDNLKKISTDLLKPEELDRISKRVYTFESKLVDTTKASKILDYITDLAEKNHFNLVQIYSDSPVLIKDPSGKEMEVAGKKLNILPVNFRVETDYKNLANFLKALIDDYFGTFTIESLHAQRTPSETLQCDITLSYIAQ